MTALAAPGPSSMQQALFRGSGLACRRGSALIFHGLGFELAAGQALLLRGPNGAGKSSLLRIMAGLLPVTEGSIAWDGEPLADAPAAHARRLCFVGHADAMKPAWSLARNLGFWSRLAGRDERAVGAALDALGVGALADVPVARLSRGQARRGALARLLLAPRPLWLLDEPTASLDDTSSALLENLVTTHCAGGGIAVVATHRPLDLGGGTAALDMAALREASA